MLRSNDTNLTGKKTFAKRRPNASGLGQWSVKRQEVPERLQRDNVTVKQYVALYYQAATGDVGHFLRPGDVLVVIQRSPKQFISLYTGEKRKISIKISSIVSVHLVILDGRVKIMLSSNCKIVRGKKQHRKIMSRYQTLRPCPRLVGQRVTLSTPSPAG